jgi:hypothetical protein
MGHFFKASSTVNRRGIQCLFGCLPIHSFISNIETAGDQGGAKGARHAGIGGYEGRDPQSLFDAFDNGHVSGHTAGQDQIGPDGHLAGQLEDPVGHGRMQA